MPEFDALMLQSVWIAGAALLVVFAGAVVQAGLGMGFGLAVAPILALLDPVLVPVTALFLGTATSIFGAMKERENIVWRQVDSALSGRLGGIFLGLFLLRARQCRDIFLIVWLRDPSGGCLFVGGLAVDVERQEPVSDGCGERLYGRSDFGQRTADGFDLSTSTRL